MADIEQAFSVCGYCQRPIGSEQTGFQTESLLESSEGFSPEEFRGLGVALVRPDDSLIGCILDEESELAEGGWNLSVFVCSRKCGKAADGFLALPSPVELRGLPDDFPAGIEAKRQPTPRPWRASFSK